MRPPDPEAVVASTLLGTVPELRPAALAEEEDDGPTGQSALRLLAELVEGLFREDISPQEGAADLFDRCLAVVEDLAVDGWWQEVGWSFLDVLAPEILSGIVAALGPRTRWILEHAGDLEDLDGSGES